MDTITFLLTLAFGFLAMMVLGTYCGMPEMGPIVAIAVAGGRIAWLLQRTRRTRTLQRENDADPPVSCP